jgi:hypothetical protein
MYEDIELLDTGAIRLDSNGLPTFRTLYIIGRTTNPPYAYFWRQCESFGSPYMEWTPWQRIEIEITGDHILPFVINRQLVIVWPAIKRSEPDANGEATLEIKFNWSRYDGVRWCQPKISRDEMALARAERFDERQGVHLEGFVTKQQHEDSATQHDVAILNVFTKSKYELQSSMPTNRSTIVPGQLTDFLATRRYKIITNMTRGEKYAKNRRDIPDDSMPQKSAQLTINWSCWIKVKQYNTDSQPKYLELAPSPKRSISLLPDEVPFDALSLGSDGTFLCVDITYEAISGLPKKYITGSLPPVEHWTVEATFNGLRTGVKLSSASLPTTGVSSGVSKTATLVFEINASEYTIADLGLEDLVPSKFERRGSFEIRAEDVFRSSSYQVKLIVPTSTECWVNGFIESKGSANSAFAIKLPASPLSESFRVLGSSTQSLFYEVIPAISGRQSEPGVDTELLPRIWYYREGQANTYIDVAHEVIRHPAKFCLYPSGFSEAFDYSTTWRNSNIIAATEAQGGLFDAQNLPLQIEYMDRETIRLEDSSSHINKQEQRKLSFDTQFPNACYNWEVFFHAPLLIADQLSKQHKFEDAVLWLQYVFDPTNGGNSSDPKRFFKFRVFKDLDLHKQVIDDLTALAQLAHASGTTADNNKVKNLIDRWRDMPFRPFMIARRRHIAFLWRTLFAYLDNLIAWADSLYRRDTRESINEATMLYVLAEHILGRRPQQHQGNSKRAASSYTELGEKGDDFANFWIDAGTRVGTHVQNFLVGTASEGEANPDGMLYFCMPYNDKLSTYWNIIEERLFNVRNCRNIEGITRSLPLTDAPIDPELLVRATAAGLDLGDVISGLYAPPPHYRYNILAARAAELANEAKALGAAMLSAIEKRDAEQLAQLRSSNEISLLRLVREVRTLQITETERNLEALRASRNSAGTRYNQYQRLLGKKGAKAPDEQKSTGEESMLGSLDGLASGQSNWGLIKEEDQQYKGFEEANGWSIASGISKAAGGAAHALSAIGAGEPTGGTYRGFNGIGNAASAIGDGFSVASQAWKAYAEKQGMMAGHIRRRDEWAFQSNQTLKELQQIDKQILANDIRIQITRKELDNHIEQIEQAKAVDEVMHSKFSNEQLYQWMISQLSGLYFNAYRMALEMARRAERAAARELGVKPLNILRNDYWDSQRSGLLAGERLHQDIKRLEIAYLDQNRREFELTKHISLRRLAPEALVNLRTKDSGGNCDCDFDIPEWLFDLDTPGHYLRRIKSVSVSIPCVAGPYTSVNCKLTLLKSEIRHDRIAADYPRKKDDDDHRFTDYFGASEAIVTSNANGDSGLFETPLRDERFLPFEGSGVISRWRLELPATYPQFDYSTISDVVLSIRYTARDGGDSLRDSAARSITELLNLPIPATSQAPEPLRFHVLLSCRSDFPTEWARAKTGAELTIPITRDLLPYWIDAVVNPKKLVVLEVLHEGSTTSRFTPIPTSPSNNTQPIATLNSSGIGEVNLRQSAVGATDKIILLSIGPQA